MLEKLSSKSQTINKRQGSKPKTIMYGKQYPRYEKKI
jgi:hypothetical protein